MSKLMYAYDNEGYFVIKSKGKYYGFCVYNERSCWEEEKSDGMIGYSARDDKEVIATGVDKITDWKEL